MDSAGLAIVVMFDFLCLSQFGWTQKYEVPRLPGAELLERDYVPDRVLLATEETTTVLPVNLSEAFLSISSDGSIVSAVRVASNDSSRNPGHILSTYSVKDGKLSDYLEIQGYMGGFWGTSEISPDGSKIAYITRDARTDPSGSHLSFRVLDFGTRRASVVTNIHREVSEISWSPDGRRIAFDTDVGSYPGHSYPSEIRTINIVDLGTGAVSEIGVGGTPSWSPSGEWIAYVGYVRIEGADSQPWYSYAGKYYATDSFELRIMSAVGTRSRLLTRLRTSPNLKPIWSPDSKTLLLNKVNADSGTCDIDLVDVVSGKRTTMFKDVGPVYAWIATN